MKITRFFGEYFKYSLHDARVQKIEYIDGNFIFTFDYMFSYENGVEQTHKAKIVFEKCDIDGLEILVFNNTILDTFTGKSIELPQYQQEYSESEFEVLTETYNWRRAVLQGWLWTEGNPVHCIMDIYFTGDMLYIIVNVNIRMYNFDDVQCTVIPSVAYGFVTGMNLQLC